MKTPTYIAHRPTSLRILGRHFTVVFKDPTTMPEAAGLCYVNRLLIEIAGGQPAVEEFDTLLHEAKHAVWSLMGIDQGTLDEERVIRALATGVTALFMDNPHLVKYLTEVQRHANLKTAS